MNNGVFGQNEAVIKEEIARLEGSLESARRRLISVTIDRTTAVAHGEGRSLCSDGAAATVPALHSLLLLTDSALPLGSFAFSSGFESLLAHRPKDPKPVLLQRFMLHSLASVAGLSLPYLYQAHASPANLLDLDNDFDASTPCTVARRASTAQGRALIAVWERAFRSGSGPSAAANALAKLASQLKQPSFEFPFEVCGHLPPVFGVVAAALRVDARYAAYAFLLNHAKAILSAAVRAGVVGPYQAQAYLSSTWLRDELDQKVDAVKDIRPEHAAQVWVPGDIWVGRHELLYSRIFNS